LTPASIYVLVLFMSDAAARRERQDAVLAELSELGLSLARELHARALAAETPLEAEKLSLAFQRVSRGVRQTFALELKLERARRLGEREDADAAQAAARKARLDAVSPPEGWLTSPVTRRKDRVRSALSRLIWDEAEGDEAELEVLSDDLEARLGEASHREDFLDLPIETLIRQIGSDMGLSGEIVITACEAPKPEPPDRDARSGDRVHAAAPPNTG
jgi:hypothetical protein